MGIVDQIIHSINNSQLEEALDLIVRYEEEYPNDVDFLNAKAILCIKVKEYEVAIECLKTLLKIDKNNIDAFYNLAYVYETLGRLDDSALYYGKVLALSKDETLNKEVSAIYEENKTLAYIKETAATNNDKVFIVLSSCAWGSVLQRMHHISRSLVKYGNNVFYISPITNSNLSINDKINLENINQFVINSMTNIDGVNIIQPISIQGISQIDIYVECVQTLINSYSLYKEIVIISYLPFQVNIISKLKGKFRVVYECVDDHSDLEYAFWGSKQDGVWEQELMDRADTITTTATALFLQRTCREGRGNVVLSRNAVNMEDFRLCEEEIPEDLKLIPEPRIVYSGAIYEWFDMELFYRIVKSNTDKSFVIIGFGKEELFIEKCHNLYFLGPKNHKDLKKYLHYMQIGIVPFKENLDIIINCDPIKLYEYIACGLPVITTFMPEAGIDKVYTYQANTVDDFNKALKNCLEVKVDNDVIKGFIIENSWNYRVAVLLNSLDDSSIKYKIEKEVNILKDKFIQILAIRETPIYRTFLALTNAINNEEKYLLNAKYAYEKLNIKYTESIYIDALLTNNHIQEAVEVVEESLFILVHYKAEILFGISNNNYDIVTLILLHLGGNYKKTVNKYFDILQKNNKDNYVKGVYYFLIGCEKESCQAFLLNDTDKLNNSPLFNYAIANTLENEGNILQAKIYKQQFFNCRNKYLNDASKTNKKSESKDHFISIIIPTRNSHEVLEYTLRTCIDQEYENYEIIVSDNSSIGNNKTEELIEKLCFNKIKYFRTPKELSMVENFNYSYGKSSGDYIICIGSDDGLLLHSLKYISYYLKILNNPPLLTWDVVAYGWPNVGIRSIRNGLFVPTNNFKTNVDLQKIDLSVLQKVLDFQYRYSILPMFYYNSIVKRETIDLLKQKTGYVFRGSPDIYTGMALIYLVKECIKLSIPLTIGGSSGKSNGINMIYKEWNEDIKKQGDLFSNNKDLFWIENYPHIPSEELCVVESFELLKEKISIEYNELHLDREGFFRKISKLLFQDDPLLDNKMQIIRKYISNMNDSHILKWFDNEIYNNKKFSGHLPDVNNILYSGFTQQGGAVFDLSNFEVTNVYEAAKFFRKIYNI